MAYSCRSESSNFSLVAVENFIQDFWWIYISQSNFKSKDQLIRKKKYFNIQKVDEKELFTI